MYCSRCSFSSFVVYRQTVRKKVNKKEKGNKINIVNMTAEMPLTERDELFANVK